MRCVLSVGRRLGRLTAVCDGPATTLVGQPGEHRHHARWCRLAGPDRAHCTSEEAVVTAITLDQATTIIEATLAKGRELGLDPLTVVVLDPGGHAVALKREDRSGILRPQIATGKAWGALGMGFASRELARRAEEHPVFVAALTAASGGRVVPVPGGVLIRTSDGALVGAVGVSGDTSDDDEACAAHGVRAAGLVADTAGEG